MYSDILCGISSDILSSTKSDIVFGIVPDIFPDILSGALFRTYVSGMILAARRRRRTLIKSNNPHLAGGETRCMRHVHGHVHGKNSQQQKKEIKRIVII